MLHLGKDLELKQIPFFLVYFFPHSLSFLRIDLLVIQKVAEKLNPFQRISLCNNFFEVANQLCICTCS